MGFHYVLAAAVAVLPAGIIAKEMIAESFTIPAEEYDGSQDSSCSTKLKGCTGELSTLHHQVAGTITVIDDCTFEVTGWEFDGEGPDVGWWAAKAEGSAADFPYPDTAVQIGELTRPGDSVPKYVAGPGFGGVGDIIVRLGKDAEGNQILLSDELNHISVWCEQFAIDFGNALLNCDDVPTATNGPAPESQKPAPTPRQAPPPATSPSSPDTPIDPTTAAAPGPTPSTPDLDSLAPTPLPSPAPQSPAVPAPTPIPATVPSDPTVESPTSDQVSAPPTESAPSAGPVPSAERQTDASGSERNESQDTSVQAPDSDSASSGRSVQGAMMACVAAFIAWMAL